METYYNGVSRNWVLSVFDRRKSRLFDVGLLGTGDGEGPWCSRENARNIIHRMKNLVSVADFKKATHRKLLRQMEREVELQEQDDEAYREGHAWVKRRRGHVAAERLLDKLPGARLAVTGK